MWTKIKARSWDEAGLAVNKTRQKKVTVLCKHNYWLTVVAQIDYEERLLELNFFFVGVKKKRGNVYSL